MLASQFSLEYIPSYFTRFLIYLPMKKFKYIGTARDRMLRIAEKLVQEKLSTFMRGMEGGKDVMTLLVRANAKEEQRYKMSDVEVNAQIA
jgi:alkylphenol/PAH-inducible cytochrome P450 monooxygenase